jgi:hypothetical protein
MHFTWQVTQLALQEATDSKNQCPISVCFEHSVAVLSHGLLYQPILSKLQ